MYTRRAYDLRSGTARQAANRHPQAEPSHFARDLKQLRTRFKNCQLTEIAMESTGQYWRSAWSLLEGHFEKLILLNPQHITLRGDIGADRVTTAVQPKFRPTYASQLPSLRNALLGQAPRKKIVFDV
jgi:hypothetical protein